ncbi:MAG: hypothetical protein NVS4B8_20720 [Herpetosiphon sp.]
MKPLVLLSILVGVVLMVLAVIYVLQPAQSLPHFLPGYDPALARHHYKHAIGAFFLGLGAFAYGWFGSGRRSA